MTGTITENTIVIQDKTYPVPPGMEPEQYRTVVEWQIAQGTPPACLVSSPPPPPYAAPSDLKKVSGFPGIEQNLLLWRVYLNAFKARDWSDLKERFVRDDQGEMQLGPLANDLAEGEELRSAVEAVVGYERRIQRSTPDFAYTDYQFFAVLFAELFFRYHDVILARARDHAPAYPMLRLYAGEPPVDTAELETWLVAKLDIVGDKVRTKTGYTKSFEKKRTAFFEALAAGQPMKELLTRTFNLSPLDDYLARINRLAFYLATGSGKTHLLHVNLMQSEAHLPAHMGLAPGKNPTFYLVAPNNELAAQHARELKRYFPNKEIGFVEDGSDKTVTDSTLRLLQSRADVRVLTTHQLAEVMKRESAGLFGASNPFGETNVVFADEGHKGSDKDTGWRDDRNRLMGERGFCFEYSATFTQSIKQKTPLLQEYAKAIIFDYPYRLFYQDGYGKKPAFFPQEQARNIAKSLLTGKDDGEMKWELTAEDRWQLFVEQMGRFHEQMKTFHDQSGNPDYRRHSFHTPLMLMMGNRVDDKDGASHVREVLALLHRFMANVGEETETMLAATGSSGAKHVFRELFRHVFHADEAASLDVRRLNDQELGLKVAGSSRYFGVVYVGAADSVGWESEPDRLAGSLMEPFFEHGDQPDVNFIIAARKLVEGWNTFRISSLGLVELGKSKGSLVVQLFGRGVRLSGTPDKRLKRTDRFPVSERFDVFGYDAAYLKTFIDEAEAAGIVEERTLEIRIDLKEGEPTARRVPMPQRLFADSGQVVGLAADERFRKLVQKQPPPTGSGLLRIDPRPLLDWQALYREVALKRQELNFAIDMPGLIACGNIALAEVSLPGNARISDRDFFQRWATGRMSTLLSSYYREHSHEYEFAQAELVEISTETSRNLSFGHYRVSGPAEVIDDVERKLVHAGAIIDSAFHQVFGDLAPVARYEKDVFAVKSKPHLFEPLLVRLENRDDIRISPDRLERSELAFVSAMHAYADTHGSADLALLRNQKEWGFLGFYPDFVLWYRKDGIEHISFIDPKGLTLHNTEDVIDELSFSLALGTIEERVRKTDPNVRLSSFILLNQQINSYLTNIGQRDLLVAAIGRLLQSPLFGEVATSSSEFSDGTLRELLSALNAREADNDIEGLLAAITANGALDRKEKIICLSGSKAPA